MANNIAARAKLSKLFERGEELRFGPDGARRGEWNEETQRRDPFPDPPGEDEVAVWIAPPNPMQRDMALRAAQASRARATLRVKREDEESVEYLTALSFLAEMSQEVLVDYVLMTKDDERRKDAERDVLAQKEWEDITALQDSWRHYAEEPPENPDSDPEYQALLARDIEFGRQVKERQDQIREGDRQSLSMLSRESLEKRALDHRAELIATQSFMKEYERQMAFYSVREVASKDVLFFESVRQFETYPKEVAQAIGDVLADWIDGTTAKNSPRAASGSNSSGPPVAPETSEASTPVTLNA